MIPSWQELILVMIFALVIFGPKRLPEIGRQIGRAIREVRRVSGEFEREVRSTMALDEDEPKQARFPMDADHSRYVIPPTDPPDEEQAPERPSSS